MEVSIPKKLHGIDATLKKDYARTGNKENIESPLERCRRQDKRTRLKSCIVWRVGEVGMERWRWRWRGGGLPLAKEMHSRKSRRMVTLMEVERMASSRKRSGG